jgi:hypothetical protein
MFLNFIFIMNVPIIWDIAPCSLYVSRRFVGTYLHLQGRKSIEQETSSAAGG